MNDWAHAATELIGRAELKRLSERKDTPGLLHLGGHVALLMLTGASISATFGTVWQWPAMFFHGVALIFLFAPLHETIHRTAFHSRALNDVAAFIIGVLVVLPREYFRAFHFAHHRFTQEAADPELATPKPASGWQLLWYVTGLAIRPMIRPALSPGKVLDERKLSLTTAIQQIATAPTKLTSGRETRGTGLRAQPKEITMNFTMVPLLMHSEAVPPVARDALRAAYLAPPERRQAELLSAVRVLYRETELDCGEAKDLVGVTSCANCY